MQQIFKLTKATYILNEFCKKHYNSLKYNFEETPVFVTLGFIKRSKNKKINDYDRILFSIESIKTCQYETMTIQKFCFIIREIINTMDNNLKYNSNRDFEIIKEFVDRCNFTLPLYQKIINSVYRKIGFLKKYTSDIHLLVNDIDELSIFYIS